MTDAHKLYRRGDPDTSREAAEKVPATRLEKMVLDVIARFPEGVISDDVRRICAEEFNVTSYSSITARYKALEEKGLIEFNGKRAGKSGSAIFVKRKFPQLELGWEGMMLNQSWMTGGVVMTATSMLLSRLD